MDICRAVLASQQNWAGCTEFPHINCPIRIHILPNHQKSLNSWTFPGGSDSKEFASNVGGLGLIPGLWRSPGGGQSNLLQDSCLENPLGQRRLEWYCPWGRKEPEMTERLSTASVGSAAHPCASVCDPTDHSTTGLPVHHQLPETAQTHVHRVSDAIQSSHPLTSPSPPAFNLSQHQGFFQWVSSLDQVVKILELQLQHQSSNEY